MKFNKHFRWAESVVYETMLVPIVALLPSPLAYGFACLRGRLRYAIDEPMRRQIKLCAEQILGDELGLGRGEKVARDSFRLRSCEVIDAMRLTGNGHSLARLVTVRGAENISEALAAGKGAILATAHFGSSVSASSLLASIGYPVNIVGEIESKRRRIYWLAWWHPILHHFRRPPIKVVPGRLDIAVQAVRRLRINELVAIAIEAPVSSSKLPRTVPVDFLGGEARLLPGAVELAKLTGAPILIMLMYRSTNWRNQVLEISAPISTEGELAAVLHRCLNPIDRAIRSHPAHWRYWKSHPLMVLGLFSPAREREIREKAQ